MPRNPFGNIHRHETLVGGKRVIVFDVTKRYKDTSGESRKLFKRCYSKAEATIQLTNFQSEVENAVYVPTERGFRELTGYYRAEYVKAAVFVNGRKVAGYRRNIKNIEKILTELDTYFGNAPIRQINYEHLRLFTETISQSRTVRGSFPAVSTINEKLSILRRLFNIAIQLDWLEINPFRRGKSLIDRAAEVKRNRMLTFDEESRLLAACLPHTIKRPQKQKHVSQEIFVDRRYLIPLIICALDTAMRRSEIFGLRWWQVDLANHVIYIKREAAERTKTGTGGILPMSDRLHKIFSERYNHQGPEDEIFARFDYKRAWGSVCKEAGLDDLQFRDLRSTGATRMVLAGNAESQVMKVTRHRNLKVFLENYSNVDVLNARRIGQNLSRFIEDRGATSNQSPNEILENEQKAA